MLGGVAFAGIAFAFGAGICWGLVFVGPLIVPEYPALLQTFGRYLAFGLVALPLAVLDRSELRRLRPADWWGALKLSAIGNFVYYLCLSSSIQRAGAPLPAMIIGTLPVVIAICANLRSAQARLPWRRMLPSLLLIALGLVCVNQAELHALQDNPHANLTSYGLGALLAIVAVGCWTWYPLHNADWLRAHPDRNPRAWATAQGLVTLPMALLGYGLFWLYSDRALHSFEMPFGSRPQIFLGLMLAIGLLSSWVGTLCWNEASQRLPPAVSGQLIVFETLAALAYAFLLRGQWPAPVTLLGVGLLMSGVVWAVRIQTRAKVKLPGM